MEHLSIGEGNEGLPNSAIWASAGSILSSSGPAAALGALASYVTATHERNSVVTRLGPSQKDELKPHLTGLRGTDQET